ncbi:serine carboxypeptidase-like 15 [Chenopodium quinoa]|uniref:serine carboxypeptidase-like 15 n=1 Tax=Chenopodium quinoa TaxID=63459 RepID=UPI000B7848DD|nr:serine carboxypeptidase-like 15 [Chenopodium quinoa]
MNLRKDEIVRDGVALWRKWLIEHPEFARNPIYITGASYSGKIIPPLTLEIIKGNEAGSGARMNLQGYIIGNPYLIGNPLTDNFPSKHAIEYAHRISLLSDELFECIDSVEESFILESKCNVSTPDKWCRVYYRNYMSQSWANDINVQAAFHVREGTINEWFRCRGRRSDDKLKYNIDVDADSAINYYQYLTTKPLRALIFR